jgi:hypothetical protein
LTPRSSADGIALGSPVTPPPSYIFASTRSRREVAAARRSGPGLGLALVVVLLLAFWAAVGVGAAALLGVL